MAAAASPLSSFRNDVPERAKFENALHKLKLSLMEEEITCAKLKLQAVEKRRDTVSKCETLHMNSYDSIISIPSFESASQDLNLFFEKNWEALYAEFDKEIVSSSDYKTHSNIISKIKQEIITLQEECKTIEMISSSVQEQEEAQLNHDIMNKSEARRLLLQMILNNAKCANQSDKNIVTTLHLELQRFFDQVKLEGDAQQWELVTVSASSPKSPIAQQQQSQAQFYSISNIQSFITYYCEMIQQAITFLSGKELLSSLEPKDLYESIEYVLFTSNNYAVYSQCMSKVVDTCLDEQFTLQRNTHASTLLVTLLRECKFFAPAEKQIVQVFQTRYKQAMYLFENLCNYSSTPTPTLKLELITRVCKTCMDIMSTSGNENEEQSKMESISTDDFLPLLICIVLSCADVTDIYSQMNFIKNFANEELLVVSEHAFYLTCLESAVFYIQNYQVHE